MTQIKFTQWVNMYDTQKNLLQFFHLFITIYYASNSDPQLYSIYTTINYKPKTDTNNR